MDSNTVALAGVISATLTSVVGFYFNAKSQSNSYREVLFANQIDLVKRIIKNQGRTRLYLIMLTDKEEEHRDRAEPDLRECLAEFSKLVEEGAAIFPVELWTSLRKYSNDLGNSVDELENNSFITKDTLGNLVAQMTKIALQSRTMIGVDELTEESLGIISQKASFNGVNSIENGVFLRMYKRMNNKDKSG